MTKEIYLRREMLKRRVLFSFLLVSIMVNVILACSFYNKSMAASTDGEQRDYHTDYQETNNRTNDVGVHYDRTVYSDKSAKVELLSNVTEVSPASEPYEEKTNVIDEIDLLERVVTAESVGEVYEGQLAVTNVILNRLSKPGWPKSIHEVVFQKGQFESVMTGKVDKVQPTQSVKKAVKAALNGKRVVDNNVVYFINPKYATDLTIPKTKTLSKIIGAHYFYKE